MIEGLVNNRFEPVIHLQLLGPTGLTREIEAVVDTGYNRYLVLPPHLATEMELPFISKGESFLASGEETQYDVRGVTALWDGRPRYIEADFVGPVPLVGMLMLEGYNLSVDVEIGGRVVIQAKA